MRTPKRWGGRAAVEGLTAGGNWWAVARSVVGGVAGGVEPSVVGVGDKEWDKVKMKKGKEKLGGKGKKIRRENEKERREWQRMQKEE